MAASPPPPQQPTPQANDDSMLLDDLDGDGESEDQLIDDDPAVPSATTTHQPQVHPSLMSAPPSTRASPNPSSSDQKSSKRKRLPDSPSQVLLEKSAKKREQREREKEQQKYLLNKLIEIFEAGGGTCAVQQGQKKFPWVDLPGALIKIGCYFAGWPERCLPKMSDKHVDRIDASTGPSQWSLKQKRAMEAQINKGAVKVLPRPQARAVIFETIDDNGNIRDSTVDFSEEWVRHKLLGEPLPIDPVPRAPNRANYTLPQRRVSADMAYTANPNVLPPIRHHHSDHPERLELPSFASMNGMHTPDNGSRSPSPYSNFSDHGRLHSLHPSLRPTHGRSSYPTPTSQDEYIPTRGRVLTLEHGLPRTAVSMRSTSRHTSSSHGYPPMLTNHHPSHLSMLSRPPSPHSNNHSVATPTSPSISPENITQPPHSGAPSPTSTNGSSVQRFPSHVPNIPSSVVAWDAPTRSWILKLQHDAPCTSLPCRPSLICWDKGRDEWELRPTQPEPGRIIWNRSLGKWQFLLPESSGELVNGFSPMFPTHFPEVSGACIFDPDHTRTWIYTVYPEAQSSLPVSSCTIEWDRGRRLWALYPDPPQAVDVSWSVESKAWHFAMKPAPNHTSPEQLPPPALCPVNSNPTSRQQPSMIETQ